MYKVCVLMTTYNPEKYLLEQLESIYLQKDVKVKIIIRDDCSSNKYFLNIAKEKYNFTLVEGRKNLGVGGNIQKLLQYAYENEKDYDYYAYSDQDDVWYDDKLITAIKNLKKMNSTKPNLYYSNLLVVDSNLNPSHELFRRNVVKNTCGQSLAQVFLFACTAVFNKEMLFQVKDINFSKIGFDTCIYYMGIWRGEIYFDDMPHIKYRQHNNNVSGQKKKGVEYFIEKLKNMKRITGTQPFKYNAKFLIQYFHLENHKKYSLIEQIANYDTFLDRIKIILNKEIKTGYYPKDFYRILRLVFNAY